MSAPLDEKGLQPCRKCGEDEGQVFANGGEYAVECENCCNRTTMRRTVADAVAAWNGSAASPSPSMEMTPEEIRLENLKQMAGYSGAIVSFDVQEPYYLASCDKCGWVGSTELCGTDSFGGDSDVYCPRCHASGADCGRVAEKIESLSAQVLRLTEENEALRTSIATAEAVHANMLRGGIPTLSIRQALHLHGAEALEKWDRAEAAEARIKALEEALRPFAALLDEGWASSHADNVALTVVWDPDHVGGKRVPLRDFRAARSALGGNAL